MKTRRLLLMLALSMSLLPACQAQEKWNIVTINETLPDSNLLPYSFQYPPAWVGQSGNNTITLASEVALLTDAPDQLEPGQIIVGLSLNTDMPPEEMVTTYTSTLQTIARFDKIVPYELNDRPAAYQEGRHIESDDQLFLIAVDMGENMRGLLSSRMAAGELRTWRKTLIKVAESLRINP